MYNRNLLFEVLLQFVTLCPIQFYEYVRFYMITSNAYFIFMNFGYLSFEIVSKASEATGDFFQEHKRNEQSAKDEQRQEEAKDLSILYICASEMATEATFSVHKTEKVLRKALQNIIVSPVNIFLVRKSIHALVIYQKVKHKYVFPIEGLENKWY